MIPPPSAPTSTAQTPSSQLPTAPSVPGLHDTLRSGLPTLSSTLNTSHPLATRLGAWSATQHDLKLEQLRRLHGLGEPLRRALELQDACDVGGKLMMGVGGLGGGRGAVGGVHEEILRGRDAEVGWEDVFEGVGMVGEGRAAEGGLHGRMERERGMGW